MTPARKQKAKKETEESHGQTKLKKKLEALAFAIFTTLGVGIGQGAVEALQRPPVAVPSQSAPMGNDKQPNQRSFPAPQKDLPTGDEPKQRLRFTYVDTNGKEQTVYTWVSMRGLVNATYNYDLRKNSGQPVVNVPVVGAEQIEINAQFHPAAPVVNLSFAKKDLADHIATVHPSLSAKDLESVAHIRIAPETDAEKAS